LQKLYPIELGESERKDNEVENEVNGYDNQKGKKKMNEKGKMEMNEKDGEKGKVESCVRCNRPKRAAALDARWRNRLMLEP
jgi:hypothetical protein